MNNKRFIIRLNDENSQIPKFEEVTELVFNNRQYALTDNGEKARYLPEDYIVVNGSTIEKCSLNSVSNDVLSILTRMFSVRPFDSKVEGGYLKSPTHVKFKKANSQFLIELLTDIKYRVAS